LLDEQTSKHKGGGRYNVILDFKGEQIKKMRKRKKEEKKKKIMYEKKIKSVNMSKDKRNFKASRLKDPNSFSSHVQFDNEDFLCASGSLFAICTCPPISSVYFSLSPP
jgi:hypothetical protein